MRNAPAGRQSDWASRCQCAAGGSQPAATAHAGAARCCPQVRCAPMRWIDCRPWNSHTPLQRAAHGHCGSACCLQLGVGLTMHGVQDLGHCSDMLLQKHRTDMRYELLKTAQVKLVWQERETSLTIFLTQAVWCIGRVRGMRLP
jgi:hypothetical protein